MNHSKESFRLLEAQFIKLHDKYISLVAANAHTENLEKLREQIKLISQQMNALKSDNNS